MRYSEKISSSNFIASNGKVIQAKDVSRELLMEKLSEYAERRGGDRKHQLIWDLSDQQEMCHFSSTISEYIIPANKKKLHHSIIPYLLAGLSHEWAELQIADVISNFALNYSAHNMYDDADAEKAEAFRKHIFPRLCSDGDGYINGTGWNVYDP